MPAFSGKTLWFSALALWLTASPAAAIEADDKAWAYDVAHAYVKQVKGWSDSDYGLHMVKEDQEGILVAVDHRSDGRVERVGGNLLAGGGESVQLVIDPKTRTVLHELRFQ